MNNLVLAGDDQHDGSNDAELQNTDDAAPPKPESEQDASGTNVGRGVDNSVGRCCTSPDLDLSSVIRATGSSLQPVKQSHNQSRTDGHEPLPKDQELPLPQTHQDKRKPPPGRTSTDDYRVP